MITMHCANCGKKLDATELICGQCGRMIQFNDFSPSNDDDGEEERKVEYNITKFIPSRDEKIITCKNCGGENPRGTSNCMHCDDLILPTSQKDEIIDIDDNVVRSTDPAYLEMYRKEGIQLYIYKLIGKLGRYPCHTNIEMQDGSVVKCNYPLTLKMERCPRCKQENEILYNCKMSKTSLKCDAMLDLSMMACPKCGNSSLLSDMMDLLTGNAEDDGAIKLVKKYFKMDFPQFKLIYHPLPIILSHGKEVDIKWDLETIGNRVIEYLLLMANFLNAATTKQGSTSMKTVFQSFNPMAMMNSIQPPQRSESLNDLLDERVNELNRKDAPGMQAQAPPVIAQVNGATDDDDNNDFRI